VTKHQRHAIEAACCLAADLVYPSGTRNSDYVTNLLRRWNLPARYVIVVGKSSPQIASLFRRRSVPAGGSFGFILKINGSGRLLRTRPMCSSMDNGGQTTVLRQSSEFAVPGAMGQDCRDHPREGSGWPQPHSQHSVFTENFPPKCCDYSCTLRLRLFAPPTARQTDSSLPILDREGISRLEAAQFIGTGLHRLNIQRELAGSLPLGKHGAGAGRAPQLCHLRHNSSRARSFQSPANPTWWVYSDRSGLHGEFNGRWKVGLGRVPNSGEKASDLSEEMARTAKLPTNCPIYRGIRPSHLLGRHERRRKTGSRSCRGR